MSGLIAGCGPSATRNEPAHCVEEAGDVRRGAGRGCGPGRRVRLAAPRERLRPFVSSYVGYRTIGPAGLHQGVPSGHLTFIISLDGTVDVAEMPDPARPPSLVHRPGRRPARPTGGDLTRRPRSTGCIIEVTWLGARALFGLPAGELAGAVVDLPALLGRRAGGWPSGSPVRPAGGRGSRCSTRRLRSCSTTPGRRRPAAGRRGVGLAPAGPHRGQPAGRRAGPRARAGAAAASGSTSAGRSGCRRRWPVG